MNEKENLEDKWSGLPVISDEDRRQSNEDIKKFLGFGPESTWMGVHGYKEPALRFDNSLDWLMQAVDKIHKEGYCVTMIRSHVGGSCVIANNDFPSWAQHAPTVVDAVYRAVSLYAKDSLKKRGFSKVA